MDIGKVFNSDMYMKIAITVIAVALCIIAVKMIFGIAIDGYVSVSNGGYDFDVSVRGDVGVDNSHTGLDVNVLNYP